MSKNVRVALIVFISTLLWFASGLWKAQKGVERTEVRATGQTAVTAAWFEARPYVSSLVARGRTEPNRAVVLRAEVDGPVIAVPGQRGQRVAAGDTVCELADQDRGQRLVQARAVLAEAELQYQGALKLKTKGYQSDVAIAQAKAALETARADLKRREIDLANTAIKAPFAGIVESRAVEVGDYMDRGGECAVVLEISSMKVAAQVSEQQVQRIVAGDLALVELVTGARLEGQISYIGQQAAPGTRTYRVEVLIPNPDQQLRAGLTAEIVIPVHNVMAQRIPSSLLSLDDDGGLGVRLLTEDDRVRFTRVQIVGDEAQGVWVLGLPERARLITVGYEYVANGEVVDVTMDNLIERNSSAAGLNVTGSLAR